MIRNLSITILMIAVGGCASSSPSSPSDEAAAPFEISQNPSILFEQPDRWREFSLNGKRIGDAASVIPERQVRERTTGGWIVARDLCRYRIEDGVITGLGVWDYRIIDRLNIHSPAQVEARFGRPESREEAERFIIYRYAEGHVHVLWNNTDKRITTVNVIK